jgi:serine phosphatase RsbU (regulator of sigma subunit)
MIIYIPIELVVNGPTLIPGIILELSFLASTLYFNYKKWFNFSRLYFFFACLLSILPMMYFVPAGAGNEFLLLPIAIIPAILFNNKWLGFSMFLFVVIIFFVVLNTREWIQPMIEVTPEQIAFFRNIYLAMVFFLVYTIAFYFRTIVNDLETINIKKNELLKLSNEEITAKKIEIEIQHTEIKASISYAKRIQQAILPSAIIIQKSLPQSFVYYQPKDIVAGDFYWMHILPQPNGWDVDGDVVLIASADCTGHGVPGAMVSVVCNNALNQSVKEHGITQPSLILDKTRDLVIGAFSDSIDNVQDGMDIALCSLNIKTNEIQYAGANNPFWLIRNGADEVEEIKANKQPIGNYENASLFSNHTIQLQKGDCFYIFTDGYADQFGGEKGKKFKYKPFKNLLLSICNESPDKQKELLNNHFEQWRGNLEQIDDVCVIGVKI